MERAQIHQHNCPSSAHESPVHNGTTSPTPASQPQNVSHGSPEGPPSVNDMEIASVPTTAAETLPPPPPPPPPPPQYPATGISAVYGKGKANRELLLDLILRSSAAVMFLIALCIMATNHSKMGSQIIHGYAFSYVDAMSAIGLAYSLYQSAAAVFLLISGRRFLPLLVSQYLTWIADQILAYLLISAASAGAATVMEAQDDCDVSGASSYCSQAAASVSVLFLAFAVMAASAAFSSHNVFKRMYA